MAASNETYLQKGDEVDEDGLVDLGGHELCLDDSVAPEARFTPMVALAATLHVIVVFRQRSASFVDLPVAGPRSRERGDIKRGRARHELQSSASPKGADKERETKKTTDLAAKPARLDNFVQLFVTEPVIVFHAFLDGVDHLKFCGRELEKKGVFAISLERTCQRQQQKEELLPTLAFGVELFLFFIVRVIVLLQLV